jgi:hypothetical protein
MFKKVAKTEVADLGVGLTGLASDLGLYAAIPGVSLASFLVKRGIDTMEANTYLKDEGIKHGVALSHACDNLTRFITASRNKELKYISIEFYRLQDRLNRLLQVIFDSRLTNTTKREYDAYQPGGKKYRTSKEVMELDVIPEIISFIRNNLKLSTLEKTTINGALDSIHRIVGAVFDDAKNYDTEIIHGFWSSFITLVQKGLLASKLGSNMLILGEIYIETLQSYNLPNMHTFILNWKSPDLKLQIIKNPDSNLTRLTKYMIDPIKTKGILQSLTISLTEYMDAILILLKQEQLGQMARMARTPVSPFAPSTPSTPTSFFFPSSPTAQKKSMTPRSAKSFDMSLLNATNTMKLQGETYYLGPHGGLSKIYGNPHGKHYLKPFSPEYTLVRDAFRTANLM